MKSLFRFGSVALISASLAACGAGVTVPDIQEFWGNQSDAQIRVNQIADQVRCEIGRSFQQLYLQEYMILDLARRPRSENKIEFLKTWTAHLVLLLTVEEKSEIAPSVSFIHPLTNMQSRMLTVGADGSTDAKRLDKLHLFYRISDLIDESDKRNLTCLHNNPAKANLFLESDLKIGDWLFNEVMPQINGTAPPYNKADLKSTPDVFTHDITFEIVSSGNITPAWKLIHIAANTGSSPLFQSKRDRTQEMILTIGPSAAPDEKKKSGSLTNFTSSNAASASFASELSSEIAIKAKGLGTQP